MEKLYIPFFRNLMLLAALISFQVDILRAQQTTSTFVVTSSVQTFTVPPCVTSMTIEARGASGGDNVTLQNMGGKGAQIIGTFTSSPGQILNIVVGQRGFNNTGGNQANGAGGGGGGSFVWLQGQTVPMIVAGGGGGSCLLNNGAPNYYGKDASITTTGTGSRSHDVFTNSPGGTGGANGTSVCGSGGKGWTAVLSNPAGNPAGNVTYGAAGGYGGGGGAGTSPNIGNTLHTAGGGGGYSGGGAGGTDYYHGGGGGGSFNAGTNQVNTGTVQTGDGVVYITYNPGTPVTIAAAPYGAICTGGTATLTASGVQSYTWTNNNVVSNSIAVNPTSNTTYSVLGTNSLGCVQMAVYQVTVNSSTPVLSISNPSSNICLGRTVSLTATGALTYTWTNNVVNGQTFTPVSTQVYTVSGQNGCGIATATTAITVAPLPVTVLASPSLVCQGYPSTLTAVSAVTGYTWQPGPLIGSSPIVAPMTNVIYTVTASDGTCSGTQTLQVNTKTTPTITAASSAFSICLGDVVTFSATGAGTGGSYSWTPGGFNTAIFTVAPTSNTIYNVVGTNSLNCFAQAQQAIIVNMPPNMSVAANKTLVCTGGSITLTASGASTYSWTGGPSTAVYTVNQIAPSTVYTVTGGHQVNNCTIAQTITLAAVIPNVVYTSTAAVCLGQSATLTATGATSYTWNNIPMASNGTFVTTPAVTSTYVLIANTNSLTVNCIETKSAVVTINPNPTITAAPTKTTATCKGQTNTLTATGAVSYTWSTGATGPATVTINPTVTTIYTVTGANASACTASTSVQAKVNSCSGIDELQTGLKNISVYPNPSNGDFTIHAEENLTVRIVNSLGQEIRVITLNESNNHLVQVKELSNGVYFLIGRNASGEEINYKIVVGK